MQGKPSKPNFARVGSRKMDESKLLKDRVENLTDSITRQTIVYTTRGMKAIKTTFCGLSIIEEKRGVATR